jgi:cytochrome c peroxidase
VREIYTTDYLLPAMVLNDIKTLLIEDGGGAAMKLGLDSQSLPGWSRWRPAGGIRRRRPWCPWACRPCRCRPTPRCQRPASSSAAALFMDRRLSHNNTLSCGMCHVPEQGFTSNELGTAIGLEGQTIRRNSPTIYNVAYVEQLFHDGREFSLENQAWGPLLAGNEMANPSIGYVVEKIRALPEYAGRFEAAFDGRGPDMMTIGLALAAYQRTLVLGQFALRPLALRRRGKRAERRGAGRVRFVHRQGRLRRLSPRRRESGAVLRQPFPQYRHRLRQQHGVCRAATGCSWLPASSSKSRTRRWMPSRSVSPTSDAMRVTLDPADSWAYRTPILRNVALTAPYMHDGSLATLGEVIEFYDRGGIDNPHKDSLLKPLGLTPVEKKALAAFLGTLTGDNVSRLVAEARAAQAGEVPPVKDPASSYKRAY